MASVVGWAITEILSMSAYLRATVYMHAYIHTYIYMYTQVQHRDDR